MSRGSLKFMRASVLVALGALHLGAIIFLDRNERADMTHLPLPEQVTTAFIQPKIRKKSEAPPGPGLSTLVWRVKPSSSVCRSIHPSSTFQRRAMSQLVSSLQRCRASRT